MNIEAKKNVKNCYVKKIEGNEGNCSIDCKHEEGRKFWA